MTWRFRAAIERGTGKGRRPLVWIPGRVAEALATRKRRAKQAIERLLSEG